ncbi:putative invertase inhibitor [Typha latifolia]|uniref:putative invertase inhibitor n=1 Tax=Typha latifolia TaxID=4733 RepID=UPI003C2F7508
MASPLLRLIVLSLALLIVNATDDDPVNATDDGAMNATTTLINKLIVDTCNRTTVHRELCVEALSADPAAKNASDVHGLAVAALKLATKNATDTSEYVEKLHDKKAGGGGEPGLEQCLEDCEKDYVDAVEQLDSAAAALDDENYEDTATFLTAAMTDVKSCQAGCRERSRNRNVLTKRNGDVNRLCSIVLTIAGLLR